MCFDDFMNDQSLFYSLLKSSLLRNKLSHAYLIDGNGNDKAYDFVLSFIKMIICEYHFSNFSNQKCKNCNICHRIENNNYSEIKIIESDSAIIKKEQLLELQSDFSRSSIEGKYRIYIIKDCDKMNKQASNSLLKFLEEPVDGIIAILLTNHFSKLLSTIVSRCQVVHLTNYVQLKNDSSLENFAIMCCNSEKEIVEFVGNESYSILLDTVFSFIDYFEENGVDILIYMKSMWYNRIQTRDENLLAFKAMIYFYYDVFKYKMKKNDFLFCSHDILIKKIANSNNLESIIKKIDIIQYGYDMVLSNLNINLLLDDIVIRLGDVV